jgi:ParB family chromosome partitioning protein
MSSHPATPDRGKRLGRGLGALLGSAATAPASPEAAQASPSGESGRDVLAQIPIQDIRANPLQPRREFDPVELAALSASLQANGLLQPITVRRRGETYELIAGERRLRAARSLGWTTIPAVVREVTDDQLLLLALVENLQRENLNPLDEAEGYRRLGSEFALTQQQIADAVGRDRSTVSNALRLLTLPADVQQLVRSNALSSGHARALLGLPETMSITEVARQVVERQLSVRQVEALAASRRAAAARPAHPRRGSDSAQVRDIRDRLRRSLQTDVDLIVGADERGEVRIRFYSAEDLERLVELLTGTTPPR